MVNKLSRYLWIGVVLLFSCIGLAGSVSDSVLLTLSQAIDLALEHHSNVRQAELGLQLARLQLSAAWTKATIPSIDLSIKPPGLSLAGLTGGVIADVTAGMTLPWGTSSKVSASLNVAWNSETSNWDIPTWTIVYLQTLDFSRLDAASQELETKKQAVEDAQFSLAENRNAVVLDTIAAYSKLLTNKALLVQVKKKLEQAKAYLTQVEESVKAGLKGETSLLEARLGVLEAQINLDDQESSYAAEKAAFTRQLLGSSDDRDIELVPVQLPLEDLTKAARELLGQEDLVSTAVQASAEVKKAQRTVTAAQEDLDAVRRSALPALALEAGVDKQGWRLGWTLSFALFAPDRQKEIKIAQAKLALAEEKLDATRQQVRDHLLNQQAALRKALSSIERLPLEQEKWALEETVKQAKLEAGAISEEDWEDFLESKNAFVLDASERATSLLTADLSYTDALGLKLEWEEWLK